MWRLTCTSTCETPIPMMTEKHYAIALALLLLPISFGSDSSAGMTDATDAGSFQELKNPTRAGDGFTAADMASLPAANPVSDTNNFGQPIESFVSSFDASMTRADVNCGRPESVTENLADDNLNSDCLPTAGVARGATSSAAGFPMYDSYSGSETSQYSRAGGSSGPISVAFGGGGSGGPIGSGPGNPDVPVSTPEPGTLLLSVCGLLMFAAISTRRLLRNAHDSN
jgi:hypothetical protein